MNSDNLQTLSIAGKAELAQYETVGKKTCGEEKR
jgi:hypothetical protein